MKPPITLALTATALALLVSGYYALPLVEDVAARQAGLHQTVLETKRRSGITAFPSMDSLLQSVVPRYLTPQPEPSVDGGFFSGPLRVRLATTGAGGVVRYTLDGSFPTARSPRYAEPLRIERTTTVRMRTFQQGRLPSEVVTHTYLVGEDVALPVVSLTTDPVNLWNPYSGMYENFGKRGTGWERNAHVEYFEPAARQAALRLPVKVRIHGNWSRRVPKKGLRLRYQLATTGGADVGNILTAASPASERSVVLRAGGANYRWRLFDELFQSLYAKAGGLTSSVLPVVLMLNGDYWGIYNVRERIDEDFLLRRVGAGGYDLVEVKSCWTRGFGYNYACHEAGTGDLDGWRELMAFFQSADMTDPATFRRATERVDLDSFTDYWLFNVYAANKDWPHSNVYLFRKREGPDRRWRWISWDTDQSLGVWGEETISENTLTRATTPAEPPPQPVDDAYADNLRGALVASRLLDNRDYRARFVTRLCDLLNTDLAPTRIDAELDRLLETVRHDRARDLERWETPEADYWDRVERIRAFARRRPAVVRSHMRERFGLGAPAEVRVAVRPRGAGRVRVNTVVPDAYPWTGGYFSGMTISLRALPEEGYRFVGWSRPAWGGRSAVAFRLDGAVEGEALFERIPVSATAGAGPDRPADPGLVRARGGG